MAAPLLTCTKVEQRSVIRFLFSEGVKPIEIRRRMKVQYGDACLSLQQVYEWCRKFQNGVTSVRDGSRPGQAHRVVTPESIAAVEGLIQANRRLTVCDIATYLAISQGSAHHIIHDVLQYRKVSDWWVPRQLTPELKQLGIDACQELLQCFEAEDKKKGEAQPKKESDAEKQEKEKAPAAKGREKDGNKGGKE